MTSRSVSRPDAKSVSKKQERLQRIALEAAKQSGRGIIPEIGKMTDLESALKTAPGKKILFYEGGGEALGTLVSPDEAEVSVFIGPEGGFDAAEVQLAKQYGATPATLGPRIFKNRNRTACGAFRFNVHHGEYAMKTVLVTGASGEIGAAIAKEFAAAGYALALHGAKHIENVNQLAETFKSNGIEAYPVCGDLSDPAACERVWADTEKKSRAY